MRFNLVSGRTPESELTSSTAAIIAGLADLPITEFNVNRAPIFTTFGFAEEETLVFPVLPNTFRGTHIQKITKNSVLFMTIWSGLQIKRFYLFSSGQHEFKMINTCQQGQHEKMITTKSL